jgi:hypothetical protein
MHSQQYCCECIFLPEFEHLFCHAHKIDPYPFTSFQGMSISDMRSLLKNMAVLLDGYQQRVSTDEILAISKSIEKSTLCK